MKINLLLGVSIVSWLVALSPVPNIGKVVAYSISIASSIQSVATSKKLMHQDKISAAMQLMNQELQETEIALHTYYQEESLKNEYAATYTPEVREELNQSLEHLLQEDSAPHPVETSTSTSELKTAILSLLEAGKSHTFIIENVLGCKGRKFEEGRKRLAEILGE